MGCTGLAEGFLSGLHLPSCILHPRQRYDEVGLSWREKKRLGERRFCAFQITQHGFRFSDSCGRMRMTCADSLSLAECLERPLTFSGHQKQSAQPDPSRNGVWLCVNALLALPDCQICFPLAQERICHSEMNIRILRRCFFHFL